jgi:excisionase family DNA binding protein
MSGSGSSHSCPEGRKERSRWLQRRASERKQATGQLDAYAVTGSSPPLSLSVNGALVDGKHLFTLAFADQALEAIATRAAEMALEVLEDPKPYLSIQEAADYLGWPKKRIYNLTAAKEIPHRKHGNRLLFVRAELDGWVANLEGARA